MKSSIVDEITSILIDQAYERGHSGGQEEVDNILSGLKWDFKDVLSKIETLEALKALKIH